MSGVSTGRLLGLLTRDAALIALAVAVWWWSLQSPDAWGPAILAALMTVIGGYLLHEWGHLLGALYKRCAIELPATPFQSFFLFRFYREGNSREQFVSMVLGGFISSFLTVLALLILLPKDALATTLALTLTGLGVLATFIIEVPEFWRVWRGGPMPSGAAFIKNERLP